RRTALRFLLPVSLRGHRQTATTRLLPVAARSVRLSACVKKLILWDIDGTLIVSGRAGIFALAKAFKKMHGHEPDFSRLDVSGRTDKWIAQQVLEQQRVEPSA